MSLSPDRGFIQCDGKDCRATTPLPIALHPQLTPEGDISAAEGWLFAVNEDSCLHFCPDCSQQHLDDMRDGSDETDEPIKSSTV